MTPPTRPGRPATTRLALAILVGAVGLVWIGQGLGLLRSRSFMVDDPTWAWIGTGMVGLSIWLGLRAWRARRGGQP
jgi:hypothetical protein